MKRRDFLTAIAAVLPLMPVLRRLTASAAVPIDGGFIVPAEFVHDLTQQLDGSYLHTTVWRINPEMLADVEPAIIEEIVRESFTEQLHGREAKRLLDGTGSAEPRGFLSSRRFTDAP